VHTTGNHPQKTLPNKCWDELANFILEKFGKYSIAEIGFEKKFNIKNARMIDLTGEKPLPVIYGLIDKSRLFIGIDSGFAHFANALNKDSLILIGSLGNFKYYMPYSGKFQIEQSEIIYYYSGSLQEMPCDDIFDLVSKKLN
jgi:heptosyltransferase-3